MKIIHKKVYLVGMMGSGKSYWADKIAQHLDFPACDLDEIIEKNTGKTIAAIFQLEGEEKFRQIEADALKTFESTNNSFVLATGGGTPCFYDNMAFMKKTGFVIWFNPMLDELVSRLKKNPESRPLLLQAIANNTLHTLVQNILTQRRSYYAQAHIEITSNIPIAENIINAIATYQQ